jgi:diguanylate cyclase (GGDEF)-like protein/PAS domain S-box-containing protein
VDKQAQEALRQSEERWQFAIEGAGDGLWDWNLQTGETFFSQRFKSMLGFAEDEISNLSDEWLKRIHPEDVLNVLTAMRPYFDGQSGSVSIEHRMLCKDGQWKWILGRGHVMRRDLSGKPLRMIGIHTDITQRKRAEDALRLTASVFAHTREGILVTDVQGCILDINAAFSRITGFSRADALGQNPRMLQSKKHDQAFYADMWQNLIAQAYWEGEIWNQRKNGEIFPQRLAIAAVRDAHGKAQQYVAIFADISERKRMEEEVRQLAFFDPLTQLPNRRMLQDRLGQTMAASKRNGHHAAVMILDLDNFKPLNDQYGHMVGDQLLTEVARRLVACVREADTVARFGGDEFVVMLSYLDADRLESQKQAMAIAEKIRVALVAPYGLLVTKERQTPVTVEHHCSASIGLVVFIDHAGSQENIIERADSAMYQAKAAGRNAIVLYQGDGEA